MQNAQQNTIYRMEKKKDIDNSPKESGEISSAFSLTYIMTNGVSHNRDTPQNIDGFASKTARFYKKFTGLSRNCGDPFLQYMVFIHPARSRRSTRLYSSRVTRETTMPLRTLKGTTANRTSVETLVMLALTSVPMATMASRGMP